MDISPLGPLLNILRDILSASSSTREEKMRKVLDTFKSSDQFQYQENRNDIVSKALHRMSAGRAPRIAVVGPTSAGKSRLVNTLFGHPVAKVDRTPDTTNVIFRVDFPSGLVVFDTPGILGLNETYENVTRLFMGLKQDPELGRANEVPFQFNGNKKTTYYIPSKMEEYAEFDCVLLVVNAHRTLQRGDRNALKSFFAELDELYKGRLVVAGTQIDLFKDKHERAAMLDTMKFVFQDRLHAISNETGEGMSELVAALFETLPEKASLARLQQSLVSEQKLSRLGFVLAEASDLLARIVLLDGEQREEIEVSSILLYAMISNHYSVNEQKWMELNGDAMSIAAAARSQGVAYESVRREPDGWWETVKSWFGETFSRTVVKYQRLGYDGLSYLVPRIATTIQRLEGSTGAPSDDAVLGTLKEARKEIDKAVAKGKKSDLSKAILQVLTSAVRSS